MKFYLNSKQVAISKDLVAGSNAIFDALSGTYEGKGGRTTGILDQ